MRRGTSLVWGTRLGDLTRRLLGRYGAADPRSPRSTTASNLGAWASVSSMSSASSCLSLTESASSIRSTRSRGPAAPLMRRTVLTSHERDRTRSSPPTEHRCWEGPSKMHQRPRRPGGRRGRRVGLSATIPLPSSPQARAAGLSGGRRRLGSLVAACRPRLGPKVPTTRSGVAGAASSAELSASFGEPQPAQAC